MRLDVYKVCSRDCPIYIRTRRRSGPWAFGHSGIWRLPTRCVFIPKRTLKLVNRRTAQPPRLLRILQSSLSRIRTEPHYYRIIEPSNWNNRSIWIRGDILQFSFTLFCSASFIRIVIKYSISVQFEIRLSDLRFTTIRMRFHDSIQFRRWIMYGNNKSRCSVHSNNNRYFSENISQTT